MQVGDRSGTAAGTAAGWSVLLPDNWYHFPLDASRQRRVAAMLRKSFASLPRDAVFPWRRDLEQQVNALLDDALAQGGSDVYLLVDSRYGLPLAATCLASLLPAPLPADVPGEVLAHTLADRDGDLPFVLLVEGRECAAIRRTESAVIEDDDPPTESGPAPAPAPARLTVTSLDVFIPFPGGDGSARTLLLSFRTPVEAVADPMMMLFEAITESLRWRWE